MAPEVRFQLDEAQIRLLKDATGSMDAAASRVDDLATARRAGRQDRKAVRATRALDAVDAKLTQILGAPLAASLVRPHQAASDAVRAARDVTASMRQGASDAGRAYADRDLPWSQVYHKDAAARAEDLRSVATGIRALPDHLDVHAAAHDVIMLATRFTK